MADVSDVGAWSAEDAILARAREVGEAVLLPNAAATDLGTEPNADNMKALGAAGLFGLGVPKAYGGLDASPTVQREVQETLASFCGVTTFTQAQHHGPSRMIANGPSDALKGRLLPSLASGERVCGVSFAHLRRPGPPILRADVVEGGYRLNGSAPWVTGWGLMDQFVFGAAITDEKFVYLWVPVERESYAELFADASPPAEGWGAMSASPPMSLCAMTASATVEFRFKDWFVPQAHWLQDSDRETMRRNDRNNVLGATAMPLGCARAGVRVLCETAERRNIAAVRRAGAAFSTELEEVKGAVVSGLGRVGEPEFFEKALEIRAWCIDLAMRTAHAAVTASSGAANTRTHPAQRLLREAMFYTIQAQTHEVMDATLARLERASL